MFNNLANNSTTSSENPKSESGVYNQFISPLATEEVKPKRDTVKFFMVSVLFLTILVALGEFTYARILKNEIDTKKEQLLSLDKDQSVEQFEAQLPEMTSLSQKLKLINSMFEKKVYVSGMLFPIIESIVESTRDSYVYFDKFAFKKEPSNNLGSVNISGVALDYPTLYRQVSNFKNSSYSPYISNFKLINFTSDDRGNVTFDISFYIDISTTALMKYLGISVSSSTAATTTDVDHTEGPLFRVASQATTSIATSSLPQSTSTKIINASSTAR